jgi:sigma-B regulation protein RsbU (phosphoserine phosphatase)
VAVVVADVAGKGIPAALLMALLHGSLRTLIAAGCRGSQLVTTLNTHLHANIPSNRLVTLFYGELDTRNGRLRYVNAGHNAPVLIRHQQLDRLPATGIALGVVPAAAYEDAEVMLSPGDRLLVFTDGITEALDREEREYGDARLEGLLGTLRALAAVDLVRRVEADVTAHCRGARQYDDMTLLVIARESSTAR